MVTNSITKYSVPKYDVFQLSPAFFKQIGTPMTFVIDGSIFYNSTLIQCRK